MAKRKKLTAIDAYGEEFEFSVRRISRGVLDDMEERIASEDGLPITDAIEIMDLKIEIPEDGEGFDWKEVAVANARAFFMRPRLNEAMRQYRASQMLEREQAMGEMMAEAQETAMVSKVAAMLTSTPQDLREQVENLTAQAQDQTQDSEEGDGQQQSGKESEPTQPEDSRTES